jgi:hypothetical protein
VRTANNFRAKANVSVRKFMDDYLKPLPEKERVEVDTLRTKVNGADHRRRYSNGSIASLLRERDDMEKTPEGWVKKGSGIE